MHPELKQYINSAVLQVDEIPDERKRALREVSAFVATKRRAGQVAELTFICTHNSRRSQMGQLWAAAAAAHFCVGGVRTHSGGTEATAFNPRAVASMQRAGFVIEDPGGENPRYRVTFDESGSVMECFSKTFDDPLNPASDFAAIMTCSDADEACPVIHGASLRAPIRFEDPKVADGTPNEALAYDARCLQIATEMLYVFARLV
ncbi:MAG: protein-tyrosine-phosphatase [Deltaproteobacteria bacterium]|nr:protein-tyrosine-phosphatase [Deltaproteobacteria bacterium]